MKTFHVRVNGLAASKDYKTASGANRAIDQAIKARPDAVISLVEMLNDKQLGEFVVYRPERS